MKSRCAVSSAPTRRRKTAASGKRFIRWTVSIAIRLSELNKIENDEIDLLALKEAGIVPKSTVAGKIILAGKLEKKNLKVRGLGVTKGARAAIEAAGGSVEG